MDTIAVGIAIVLAIIAAVHVAWAAGMVWPGTDEASLSCTVVGTPGATKMPPRQITAIVATAILLAALWPLLWRGLIPYPHIIPQSLIWLGMWVLTLVFLGRGAAGYLPAMARTEQPFARLNRLYYSPLCLALGLGFLVLVLAPLV